MILMRFGVIWCGICQAQQTNEIAELSAEKNELSRAIRDAVDEAGDLQRRVGETRAKAREAAGLCADTVCWALCMY
jgi:hypothetical protein